MKNYLKGIVFAVIFAAVLVVGGEYAEESKAPVYAPTENIAQEATFIEEKAEETEEKDTKTTVNTPAIEEKKLEKTVDSLRAKEEEIKGENFTYEVPMTDEEELNNAKEQAANDNKDNVTELDCEEQIVVGTKTEDEKAEEVEVSEREQIEVPATENVVVTESFESNPETANEDKKEEIPLSEQLDTEMDFSQFGF